MYVPSVGELGPVLEALASWQVDGGAFQLHPGDLGWHWRFGAEETAAVVRVWAGDDGIVAVGMVDGPTMRLALDPARLADTALAAEIVGDVIGTEVGSVEAPAGSAVRVAFAARGWTPGEGWAPLVRDLSTPVQPAAIAVRVVGEDLVDDRVAVQRAAFENSIFTADAWRTMAAGPAYARAQCLLGFDSDGEAVATVTVWSAGPGRPGLIEPMGVHHAHRGRGYGTAITVAAAQALRELGASCAIVATPADNRAGVATYVAAGFTRIPVVRDLTRPA